MQRRIQLLGLLCVCACDDEVVSGNVDASHSAAATEVADVAAEVSSEVASEVTFDSATELDIDPADTVTLAPDTEAPDTILDSSAPDIDSEEPDVADVDDTSCQVCSAVRPVILVHGINGAPANFDVMAERLIADGWPADYVVRFAAADPAWGCNVDNAAALAELVEDVKATTCQGRVDIVAHSMGSLSSRYYLKELGGHATVNSYVTLGGMHHGLFTPCLAPEFLGVCVWQELCQSGTFIAELNADPATPGDLHWVSIYGTADETVPNESSHLDGAENIVIEGAEHDGANGLEQRADVYAEIKRALGYDCW